MANQTDISQTVLEIMNYVFNDKPNPYVLLGMLQKFYMQSSGASSGTPGGEEAPPSSSENIS